MQLGTHPPQLGLAPQETPGGGAPGPALAALLTAYLRACGYDGSHAALPDTSEGEPSPQEDRP